MWEKLSEFFPELDRVSDKTKFRKAFIANRDGELSICVHTLYLNRLLEDFDIPITDTLIGYIDDATKGYFVDITSLQSNQVRFYSALGYIYGADDFTYPDHEGYGQEWGVGVYYDPEEDAITMRKKYYINEAGDTYTHFKYPVGGEESGPYVEVADLSGPDAFIDTLDIVPELQKLDVSMFSTRRLDDDVSQTYLHVR